MKHIAHITALAATIIAIIIFVLLKPVLGFIFGLRTYWPLFVCLYLIIWYYISAIKKNAHSN